MPEKDSGPPIFEVPAPALGRAGGTLGRAGGAPGRAGGTPGRASALWTNISGPGFFSACQGFPLCFAQSFVGGPVDFDTAVIVNSATNFTNVLTGFNSVINQ